MGRLDELEKRLAGELSPERKKSPVHGVMQATVDGACSQPSERDQIGVGGESRTRLNRVAAYHLAVWFHQHEIIRLYICTQAASTQCVALCWCGQMWSVGRRPVPRVLSQGLVSPVDDHPSRPDVAARL